MLRVRSRFCAVPLEHVIEVMRPLPVDPLPGTPPYVLGAAIVRGRLHPVVELGALLGVPEPAHTTRFVSIRTGDRALSLAVDSVVEVGTLVLGETGPTSNLLAAAESGIVASLRALDSQLLVVLEASRLVPEEAWTAVVHNQAAR